MKNRDSKVLVVDDLKSIRLTLGGILEDEGHTVVTAENGYQAIEVARGTHFDVIFMDIKMPGINGVQTFREIKKLNPEASVIMMTAYSVEDLVQEALDEGAYTIIHKPFDIDRVITIIEDLLRMKTRILVVDNQSGDRETLKGILEAKGYRVAVAKSGTEAIEMVRSRHYDIVFLDIELPDSDAARTLGQIHRIDPQARVIIMTDDHDDSSTKGRLNRDVSACIYKPLDITKVMKVIEDTTRLKAG
jgi:DNA-binding NtrC family response regulator